jgi:hypothetical protein
VADKNARAVIRDELGEQFIHNLAEYGSEERSAESEREIDGGLFDREKTPLQGISVTWDQIC